MANKVLQQGAIRPILASAPSGLAGVIYYDSGVSKLKFHNGTTFVELADFGQLGSSVSGSSGATLIKGDNKAYTNISGLSTYTLQDFLDKIDLALGSAGASSFSDAAFEVYNSTTPTKKIMLDASAITAATTRTLKMANANVDLAALTDSNIASAAAIALTKLAAVTANRVLLSDASGFVSASSVTNTTLSYLDATSSIQTQLNGKEPTITTLPIAKGGTNSSTALNNDRVMKSSGGAIIEAAAITAARVLISDANGIPTHSTVTSTTLGYLDATSSIQTQLNGKEPTITTLSIAKGGTNSSTALSNNRVMTSVAGAIVEAAAITASRALVSDSNGIPVASTVTSTTLGYLDATSSVQTQLNSKLNLSGGTMSGAIDMGSNKITSSYVPLNGVDLVNKTYVDNALTGIGWIHPVEAFNLRGNLTIAGIDGLSPVVGDQYVATDAGTPAAGTSDALAAGDIAEFNGTSWKKIISNSGGFVPAGIRAILGGAGASIASPYTDATDNDKLVIFSGSSNTGVIQAGVVVDQVAVLVQDPGHISYFDNAAYVYEGSAPSGSWVQFNGAGQVAAGVGLSKTGNTLDVKLGAGIVELPTDEVGIHLWGTAPGLILTTDGTTSSTASGAQLRAYGIADANIAAAAAIALTKLAAVTANRVLLSDASGFVSASSVTNTTLSYLDATSSIQTQLNGKEPSFSTLSIAKGGTNSGTALNNGRIMSSVAGAIVEAAAITAARVLISDANGIPTHSTVTSTTLGYLDATSSIQTQLNGKEPTITTLPISKGGTNSSTALSNDRVMISNAGAVVEASAITANRALVSNASGIPVASSVTTTTLEFLDATSSVQTQLNGKLANVVEDTTPQLGGDLDPNGKAISNTVRFGSGANSMEQDYFHAKSLTASTTAVLSDLTFDSKVYKSLIIEYTARNGNNRRTGTIMVSADNTSGVAASNSQLFHEELDTVDLGLTWSCALNGDNVEVSYTTGAGTYVANLLVKRFKA